MRNNCKDIIKQDYKRYSNKPSRYIRLFLKFYRKAHYANNSLLKKYYRFRYYLHSSKHGIEVSSHIDCGEGLYVGHPYNITINDGAILGKNINIHKGVTIGQENRGIRKGAPTIGNEVWIGVNATIVGKITIGNDVLIAPNSYVNFDVPDHSIVIGNPGKVIHREHATEGYINNKI